MTPMQETILGQLLASLRLKAHRRLGVTRQTPSDFDRGYQMGRRDGYTTAANMLVAALDQLGLHATLEQIDVGI